MRVEQRGDTHVLVDGVGCRPATAAEIEMYAEIERLRAALADCMQHVDCDNLTTQHKHQCWQAVLDGKPFVRGNVKVVTARRG